MWSSTHRASRRTRRLGGACALLLSCGAAWGQSTAALGDQIETQAVRTQETAGPHPVDRKPSFVVMPIPMSDPMLGTGLTLAAAALYNPNGSERPWVTGAGVLATSNGSHAYGAFQQASFLEDRLRVLAFAGKADMNLRFYGIGSAAGEQGISVPTRDSGDVMLAQALYGVTKNLFLGLRLQSTHIKTELDLSEVGNRLGVSLPAIDLDHRTVLLGPALDYDTRDNQFMPRKGDYATLRIGFSSPSLGSDLSYRNLRAGYARYWPLNPRWTLAGRVSTCAVDGRVPFPELCLYGAQKDLRGYPTGQYRDRNLYAAQAELRWHFGERFGAVFFAGTGAVARKYSELLKETQLPSAGAGLRWMASKKYGVNVSVDVAVGRDGHAVYFYIGEAF
ncbi:BamA/TamA family outer membrane protein [Comamonas antarctica]|uniref:BamA/TamA family outer membrane protein n=1 Tax=Comamonas antarctica TaxID=2743470 RepID=UPI0028E402E3|nr:BamA/TamA family outer membrane protein [Comamonas antarctica]